MSAFRPVCRLEQVPVERGVAALVDGEQVALFRTADGSVHALANRDPFSGAMVLSRGIVGSRGEAATVAASPRLPTMPRDRTIAPLNGSWLLSAWTVPSTVRNSATCSPPTSAATPRSTGTCSSRQTGV